MVRTLLLFSCLLIMGCQSKTSEKLMQSSGQNEIAYTTGGKGETIIFLHAGGLDKSMWNKQINTFKNDFKVIAYDLRGHGQTQIKNEQLLEIDDLVALLDKEDLNQVHLVGLSFGAIIALDFTLAYPDKVKKLVLASPGLIGFQEQNSEFLELFTAYYKTIQNEDKDGMVQMLKKLNAVGKTDRKLSEDINTYVENQLKSYIDKGFHLRPPKIKNLAPIEKLGQLTQQTLILYGDQDFEFNHLNAQELAKHIPQSTLQKVKNSGHLINLEQTATFNKALYSFLK